MIRNFFSYMLWLCCLGLFATSCEQKENLAEKLAGTWQLTILRVNGQSEDISTKTGLIQFQVNSVFQSYNLSTGEKNRGGWSFTGNMLNISLDLPAAYYVQLVDAEMMTLKRLDFDDDGSLKTTELDYVKVDDNLFP